MPTFGKAEPFQGKFLGMTCLGIGFTKVCKNESTKTRWKKYLKQSGRTQILDLHLNIWYAILIPVLSSHDY